MNNREGVQCGDSWDRDVDGAWDEGEYGKGWIVSDWTYRGWV